MAKTTVLTWAKYPILLLSVLVNRVYAADEPFIDQFFGSPLLVLVAVIIIDAIAVAYHRLRR